MPSFLSTATAGILLDLKWKGRGRFFLYKLMLKMCTRLYEVHIWIWSSLFGGLAFDFGSGNCIVQIVIDRTLATKYCMSGSRAGFG